MSLLEQLLLRSRVAECRHGFSQIQPGAQSMMQYQPGQRWISTSEPELGLGVLLDFESGKATVLFTAAQEKRIYSVDTAPLVRVRFKEGDQILLDDGSETLKVDAVVEEEGLLTYRCGSRDVSEGELSDTISFSKPEDRLLSGQCDDLRDFNLRIESLFRAQQIRRSPVRGLLGGRVDLIPHQIAIAKEVSSRIAPRVLLADEVGLGKTIEACLIMHRLHLTGRADRVLIILPEPLVHQWFVELLRRFNLLFALFDEERCQSIREGNPFLDSQLVICSQEFLLNNPQRIPEVLEAGWDMLIVDEVHHLEWSPEEASEAYELVQGLAEETPSVVLLSATPQQLGPEGHFARLQLLDSHRYNDLEEFLAESERYERVADAIDLIKKGGSPDPNEFAGRVSEGLGRLDELGMREQVTRDLLDSFGTGRVMFRNTRKQLSGFPERKAHLIELEGDELQAKVVWLVDFLARNPSEKILLICKTIDLVEEITEALLNCVSIKVAQFHEELTLLQRDRNAAYFAEDDGARLLICSEIGSEGRNFQFAHHLVLYDLPENPELLEQRIGRLDRIGQIETIHLHIPFTKGSRDERYARWYQEGLNAFEKNLQGAALLVKKLQELEAPTLDEFIAESKILRAETEALMERGQDRLLALTSRGDGSIEKTLELIGAWDGKRDLEDWMMRLFDHFGINVEELGNRDYLLKPGHVITDAFPDLPEDGMSVTFDRQRALSREEIGLMTADHPMVVSAIDLLLSGEGGNSAFGVWESTEKALILEAYFVIECVAPATLQIDYFLPATPVRLAVNHQGRDLSGDQALLKATLRRDNHRKILDQGKVTSKIIPAMLAKLHDLVRVERDKIVGKAVSRMHELLAAELTRMIDLQEVNPMIDDREISALKSQISRIEEALAGARIRLDCVRLVYKLPKF
ncbi:MAG: helicase-related protein [Akkermansiaceae bacterium]